MRSPWLAAAILGAAAAPAQGQSIGVFADQNGTVCTITAPFATPFQYYVLVRRGPLNGITGAEFRVEGVDPAWFTMSLPVPGSCDPGCPNFVGDGGGLAFPLCQAPESGVVLLATIQSLALAPVPTRTLRVEGARFPSNPAFACPLLTLCDAPAFTTVCVAGGEAVVNGPCTVAVQRCTWSDVKALFH